MCGIVTLFNYGPKLNQIKQNDLDKITDYMQLRGPDGRGTWISDDKTIGLGHRRLSIIGLGLQGYQPMLISDSCQTKKTLAITFNGEIYNFRKLKADLEQRGHKLKSATDTEVLLHLYEEYGIEMLSQLRGMFAFAIWDGYRETLHIARDPYGIKPLYLSDDGNTIKIASQTKALIEGGSISKDVDDGALAGFFLFGNVPEPRTVWKNIKALPAGSVLSISKNGSKTLANYASVSDVISDSLLVETSDEEKTVSQAFIDSVESHLVADVEVGVFLSSGIDSTALLALAGNMGQHLRTFTLGFEEFENTAMNEVPLASDIANKYGSSEHHIKTVSKSDFISWLPKILSDMDQPSIDGLNTWMVAKAAADFNLKVALSGIGGDELLGGYSTFKSVPKLVKTLSGLALNDRFGTIFRKLTYPLLESYNPKVSGILEYSGSVPRAWLLRRSVFMPWELPDILGKERAINALGELNYEEILTSNSGNISQNPVATVASLEATLYMRNQLLRDADWAGMGHSLEIRVPFVDIDLLKSIAPFLTKYWKPPQGKIALANSPKSPLPDYITNRPKTGFSVPMQQWASTLNDFDSWKRLPKLSNPRCSWARRWAYTVADKFELL